MPEPHPGPGAPGDEENSLPLDHSHILLTSFNSFLTVAIHNILYYRNIYPAATFLSTRAYNLPVHQNRHPKVCAWIRDAVDAVAAQLSAGHVARIAIVIHSPYESTAPPPPPPPGGSDASPAQTPSTPSQPPPGSVLERWVIDTSRFPAWPSASTSDGNPGPTATAAASAAETAKGMRDFARVLARDARSEETRERHLGPDPRRPSFGWADLDEQLRGALRRMASVAEAMAPLPVDGCTFTVAVELAEGGRAPIGHPQVWIPSEPNLQPKGRGRKVAGQDVGGVCTRPIRSVEAGPLFFECWVEESRAKEALMRMAERGKAGSQSQSE
ncbi:hypothetical protein VTH06DRAFT_248 [Thermothelomyces fergusii]